MKKNTTKVMILSIGLVLVLISGCKIETHKKPDTKLKPPIITCIKDGEPCEDPSQMFAQPNCFFRIDTNNEGATAYWTLDRTDPTLARDAGLVWTGHGEGVFDIPYSDEFIDRSGDNDILLKVIAVKEGYIDSDIAELDYQMPPP